MAFKARISKALPDSMEGLYLFPMWWFAYGVQNKYLEITDTKKFSNSLQGSILSWMMERLKKSKFDVSLSDHTLTLWKDDSQCDLWLVYRGSGEIEMHYYPSEGYTDEVKWPNSDKYDHLEVMGLKEFSKYSINDQKTLNGMYINLFAGCGITINERVWFTELNNIFC